MDQQQVKQFWKDQAIKYKDSYAASWTDKYAMELENDAIAGELVGPNILDAGCANGFKTIELAKRQLFNRFTGIDYIPEMIDQAKTKHNLLCGELLEPIKFSVGDIMGMDFPDNSFDTVMVTRVLINLGTRERQIKAVDECVRVLRDGGRLVVSEACVDGWCNLNLLRNSLGMPSISMPEFNTYLNGDDIFCNPRLELVSRVNFSSTYFLGTRVIKPILINMLGLDESPADPNSEINRMFSKLAPTGDYGIQQMFVFNKVAI